MNLITDKESMNNLAKHYRIAPCAGSLIGYFVEI